MAAMPPITTELLLAHGDWMRALARHLCGGPETADDYVQDTWVATLRSPPDPERPARPWLAQVLRNAIRSDARERARRRQRAHVLAHDQGQAPSPDEVLARTQLRERVAALMSSLEEPYRTTLFLRFYEGHDASTIGHLCAIPPGTVRWRISEGVARLRARLDRDDQAGDGRKPWRALLAPLGLGPSARPAGPRPTPWLALGLGTAAVIATVALVLRGSAAFAPATDPTSPLTARLDNQTQEAPRTMTNKTSPNNKTSPKKAGALLGIALPVLVAASAHAGAPRPIIEEGVNLCVEMREKIFECKQDFADAFVAYHNPPPAQRKAMRAETLEEIAADGAGPLEPRKDRCRAMGKAIEAEAGGDQETLKVKLDGMKKVLAFCAAKTDCKERAECMLPFIKPGAGRKPK